MNDKLMEVRVSLNKYETMIEQVMEIDGVVSESHNIELLGLVWSSDKEILKDKGVKSKKGANKYLKSQYDKNLHGFLERYQALDAKVVGNELQSVEEYVEETVG